MTQKDLVVLGITFIGYPIITNKKAGFQYNWETVITSVPVGGEMLYRIQDGRWHEVTPESEEDISEEGFCRDSEGVYFTQCGGYSGRWKRRVTLHKGIYSLCTTGPNGYDVEVIVVE